MTWFAAFPAISIYLWALGCIVGALPVNKEGIQGSSEGSDGTAIGVKISCDQRPLMNVLIADHCNCIAGGGIRPFPNQLFE